MAKEIIVTAKYYTLSFNQVPENNLVKEIVNYFTYHYNGLIPCLEISKVLSNVCNTNIVIRNPDIRKFRIEICKSC